MDAESPMTPDVDLPGQEQSQADLDIVVRPEPESAHDEAAPPGVSEGLDGVGPAEDPAVGNTLIRPENS